MDFVYLNSKNQKIKLETDINELCFITQQRTNKILCLINNKIIKFYNKDNYPKNLTYVKKINKDNYLIYVFKNKNNIYYVYNRQNCKILGYNKNYKNPLNKITNNENIRLKTDEELTTLKRPKLNYDMIKY